jgi:hypothetical protein
VWRGLKQREKLGKPEDLLMREFVEELRRQKENSDTDVYCGNGPIERVDKKLLEDIVRLRPDLPGDEGNLWIVRRNTSK